tara:strand:+ start:143 stop:1696 length:1554 start_codon:yes stop_codon:yes gene_type:complete
MGVYDYIIVGGGISGLFMTYKLSQTGKDILLIESTNRLGGRLLTKQEQGVQFELGAARISSKHSKVMSLLKECKLDKDLIQLPDKINYKIKGPKINFYSLVNDLVEGSKLYTKQYLQSINLLQLCIDVLGQPYAELLQKMLGYDSEFIHLNAHYAIKTYKKDLFSSNHFYVLKHGFSSLVKKLENSLKEKDNVTIKLDTRVTDVGKNHVMINKQKRFGGTILCCLPYYPLSQLPKFKDLPEVNSVSPIPLIRIYAKYPKDESGKVWFHNLKRTITDNYIRHIIPIDYDNGLIMISYTDGDYASMWSNLTKLGNKVLIDHLHSCVKDVLGKEPPNPEFITYHYWKGGVHMWKPGQNIKQTYDKMLKPFEEKIYVINEAYSSHQSWVEGSLDMCYDVLERLNEKFIREKPKKGGGEVKKNKVYSLDQVLEHRNWIVMDINQKLRIYDVGKWLKDHPGGRDNLKRGIKANRHYKDPEKYPESPIQLFKQIGAHKSGNVLQKFLIKGENDKVKYIGIMKKV